LLHRNWVYAGGGCVDKTASIEPLALIRKPFRGEYEKKGIVQRKGTEGDTHHLRRGRPGEKICLGGWDSKSFRGGGHFQNNGKLAMGERATSQAGLRIPNAYEFGGIPLLRTSKRRCSKG